eukprot:403341868
MDYTKLQPNLFPSNNLQIVIISDGNSTSAYTKQALNAYRKVKAVDPENEGKLIWMIVLSVFCMILSIFVWGYVATGQYFKEFFTILEPESDSFDCYDSCGLYALVFHWACLGSYVAYQLPIYLGIFIISYQAKNDSSFQLSQGTAKLVGSILIGISSILACFYLIYPYFYMQKYYHYMYDLTLGIDVVVLVITLLQEVFFLQIL